jgi:hypothetical protein
MRFSLKLIVIAFTLLSAIFYAFIFHAKEIRRSNDRYIYLSEQGDISCHFVYDPDWLEHIGYNPRRLVISISNGDHKSTLAADDVKHFARLIRLEQIDIAARKVIIDSKEFDKLSECKKMRWIVLDGYDFSKCELSLGNFNEVERIVLRDCNLPPQMFNDARKCSQLTALTIDNCNINENDFDNIADIPSLTQLLIIRGVFEPKLTSVLKLSENPSLKYTNILLELELTPPVKMFTEKLKVPADVFFNIKSRPKK